MQGDIRKVTSLTFLVKWLGYEEKTHEPWGALKDNEKLHEFLISKNLKNIIPRKYLLSSSSTKTTDKTTDD